jgi:hypothetical protein
MITEALLSVTLGHAPLAIDLTVDRTICAPASPAAPSRLDITRSDSSGRDFWGVEATFALSSGDIGLASFALDARGTGEATLSINDDVVAQVAVDVDVATGQLVSTSWWPDDAHHSPDLIAELMQVDLPSVVADSLPQEFKCGTWKSVAKALWTGATVVAAYTCCAGTTAAGVAPACVACLAGGAIGGSLGSDAIEGLCD